MNYLDEYHGPSDEVWQDEYGNALSVGDTVVYGCPDADQIAESTGTLVEFTDWDADVDDDGRTIGRSPTAEILFADGERVTVHSHASGYYPVVVEFGDIRKVVA